MTMTSFPPDIISKDDLHKYNALLNDPEVTADANKLRQILQSLLAEMTCGMDISEVFMSVIKVCGNSNMVIKKLAYLYLSHYAEEKPDLALLVVNTLLKDCKHPNPMIRGLALRTFSSLSVPAFLEYSTLECLNGLKDKSAYVRRVAVNACAKLHSQHPQFIQDNNIVDTLYDMIRDKDPITVINCLMSLEEILRMEGGVVINKKIAYYLLNRLKEFTEWGQSLIFNLLLKFKVKGEDEVIDVLNLSDSYLKHPNSGVSLAAVTMMLHLTSGLTLRDDVYKRVRGPLLNVLTSGNSHELVFAALCHIQWILTISPTLFTKHYKKFYCRYQEPEYIKFKKLYLLQSLATPGNLQDIVEEISVYCNDVSSAFATHSVKTIGSIAKEKPSCTNLCLDYLLSMLKLQLGHVISEVLAAFQDLLSYEVNMKHVDTVMEHLPSCAPCVSDTKGKTALLWLVGHYGQNLPDAPYLLEDYIDAYDQENSSQVKVALLTATTKLFFYRPAECQSMLGKLLDSAIATEDDIEVQEKAVIYYKLLQADVQKAKKVICASLQPIPENLESSNNQLQELPEGQFNSLSLLLDKDSLQNLKESTTCFQELSAEVNRKEDIPYVSEGAVEGTLVDIASALNDSEANESHTIVGAVEGTLVDIASTLNDSEASESHTIVGVVEGTIVDIASTLNDSETNESDTIVGTVEGTLVDIAGTLNDSETNESETIVGAVERTVVDLNSTLNVSEIKENKYEGAVDGILDVNTGETSVSKYRKDAVMTHKEFEEQWIQWETRVDDELALLEGPSTAVILEALSSNSIKTLATSDDDSQPWKAFCFIQEESGRFYLLELNYHQQNEMIAYKIKCQEAHEEAISTLVTVLKSCFT